MAAAAAPRAPVAPASPALLAAAAAQPGRPGGAEVSRGPRGSGTGAGPQGADPPPPPGGGRPQNRGFPRISPAQHAPRCSSWISTSGRTPFLPTGPRPTGWRVAPSPGGSLSAAGTPHRHPISLSGSSSFYILGVWGSPYSHPRSGSPSRPSLSLPFCLE